MDLSNLEGAQGVFTGSDNGGYQWWVLGGYLERMSVQLGPRWLVVVVRLGH